MPTRVDCPCCSQTVAVPDEYVRKSWSCPACKHRFAPDPAIHRERPPVESGVAHAARGPAGEGGASPTSAGGFGWSALGAAFAAGALAGALATWLVARG